jgi:hypothetical protein
MIKLENNEKLYFIENKGCDDTTRGLAIITDEDFPKFKDIIENLNKNSNYGCMPTIDVYKIDESLIREVADGEEIDVDDIMYLDGKRYTGVNDMWDLWDKGEKVI